MWKWKNDLFYFSKGDRIAIILLLNLIVISGGIFICINKFTFTDSVYRDQNEEVQKDFVQFENNLGFIDPVIEEITDNHKSSGFPHKQNNVNRQKLESGQTIDINVASITTLTRVPGIGNTFAERIIDYRNALGGFASLEQLYEIKGITVNKFSKILPYLIINNKHKTIDLNNIPPEELAMHPYFEEKQIQFITTLRQTSRIESLSQLKDSKFFTSRDLERIYPYLQ